MYDPRITTLARTLVRYSVNVQKSEKVLIQSNGIEPYLVKALIKEIYAAGGFPFLQLNDHSILRELYIGTSEEHMKAMAKYEAYRMNEMDAFIGFTSLRNASEFSDVPHDKMDIYYKYFWKQVHTEIRVPKTKWVVLRYPSSAMAQLADMSTEAFEDFYFNVCNLDYAKMSKAMESLVKLMENTDKVRIVGKGTDLSFSIKGLPAIKCDGKMNIPDGEVYTAPIKDSVNGFITYNAPSEYQGFTFENIRFEFKDGKIIHATSNNIERLNKILDTDEGARYIGEFAIGVNPYITKPMKETLFDEKIAGSIHFTPGNAYDNCFNGNRSAIHWDLVYIQTPEYGGGEIYFDDVLIRKDGRFVIPELENLNPENLK
ncbi:MAG: aminopeptidase [Epulopiscium sp.]|nr:aminopeptidase [Candidatus Epulonipiscium sp.]